MFSILPSDIEFIPCHILEIEFIEMREPAVPAADSKMAASNGYIMRSVDVAVSAICGFLKVPDIVTPYFCECSRLRYILDTGDKDPGCTTIIALYFGFIGDCLNDLICNLSAVIAVSPIPGKDKLVAHARYWMRMGSLICCMTKDLHQKNNVSFRT